MYVEAGLIPAYRSPEVVQWPGGDKPRLCADLRHIVHETALNLLSYTPSEANSSLDSIGHTTKDSQNNRRLQNINLIGMPAFYYL